jgi:hypothetical protein
MSHLHAEKSENDGTMGVTINIARILQGIALGGCHSQKGNQKTIASAFLTYSTLDDNDYCR